MNKATKTKPTVTTERQKYNACVMCRMVMNSIPYDDECGPNELHRFLGDSARDLNRDEFIYYAQGQAEELFDIAIAEIKQNFNNTERYTLKKRLATVKVWKTLYSDFDVDELRRQAGLVWDECNGIEDEDDEKE